jgi:hypothetical protein
MEVSSFEQPTKAQATTINAAMRRPGIGASAY